MFKVKFAIPKGHLENDTLTILRLAGYTISNEKRKYRPYIDDQIIDLKILRPQEIPMAVEEGVQDIGIAGIDWVKETKANVEILCDLEFAQVKLVLAVSKSWTEVNSLSDLLETYIPQEKKIRVSTEYLNIASDYIKRNESYNRLFQNLEPSVSTPWWRKARNEQVNIILSFGATEAKPPEDADAIIDVMETGTSLERNNLKVIETLLETSAVLIANKKSLNDPMKREKIYDVKTLIKGVVDARKKLHIFVNVSKKNLDILLKSLPALKKPTISPLSDEGWYSVNTVIDRTHFLEILPTLRRLTHGLVVYEPRQVLLLNHTDQEKSYNERWNLL